jgi:hypothetical protein
MLKFQFALILLLLSIMLSTSRKYYCKEHDRGREDCPDYENPVCGYYKSYCSAEDDTCKKTYPNKCEACKHTRVKYVLSDECQYEEEGAVGYGAPIGGAATTTTTRRPQTTRPGR